MSYTPPLYTDAGGSVASGYVAPTYFEAGGDVAPVTAAQCAYDQPGFAYDQPGRQYNNFTCNPFTIDASYFDRQDGGEYVLLAELYFEGGHYLQRVATDWWYSKNSDSIGVKEFQSRIVQEPGYGVILGCNVWNRKTTVSIGSLGIVDPSGELDWMQRKTRDSICVLRLALPHQSYDDTRVVGVLLVDSVDMDGLTKQVNLRGIDTLLDRQLVSNLYGAPTPASSTSSSTSQSPIDPGGPPPSTSTENTSIEGEPYPLVLGDVFQMEPVLVDANGLVFQLADMPVVGVDALLSGGSVALPPDSSEEEWDYTYDRTSVQMFVTPDARVTVNASGVRALTSSIFGTRFTEGSSDWTPSGESSGASVTYGAFTGATFATGSVGESGLTLSRPLGLSEGDWCVVLVEVTDIVAGHVVVDFGTPREIKREGRHALVGQVGPSGDLVLAAYGGPDGAEFTVASVYAYGLEEAVGTSSLREIIRHMTVVRGAIPDSETVEVELIPNGVVPSSSWDFTNEFSNESAGAYLLQTADVGGSLVIQGTVGDESQASYFRLIWPSTGLTPGLDYLQPGQRYHFSVDWVVTDFAGVAGADYQIKAYFKPRSGSLGGVIALGSLVEGDQFSSARTFDAYFTPTEEGWLYLAFEATSSGLVSFEIDNLSLKRVDSLDDGATIDFGSLADIDSGYAFGYVAEGNETVREALQRTLDSFSGWFFPNESGRIQFGKLAIPSGPVSLVLNDVNLLSVPSYKPDLAPGLSDTLAAERNWSPYNDSELAGITYPNRPPFKAEFRAKRRGASADQLARDYTHAVGAKPIPTVLATGSDAEAEANRLTAIYTNSDLGFWECEVALESALEAALLRHGEIVKLDDPLFANDNGKLAVIVGKESVYRSNRVHLTCWGASGG